MHAVQKQFINLTFLFIKFDSFLGDNKGFPEVQDYLRLWCNGNFQNDTFKYLLNVTNTISHPNPTCSNWKWKFKSQCDGKGKFRTNKIQLEPEGYY